MTVVTYAPGLQGRLQYYHHLSKLSDPWAERVPGKRWELLEFWLKALGAYASSLDAKRCTKCGTKTWHLVEVKSSLICEICVSKFLSSIQARE